MRAELKAWLGQATPDYQTGLKLLKGTGYDQQSLTWNLLQRGADTFTRTKLRNCLTAALASLSQATPQLLVAPAAVMIAPVDNQALKAPLLNERTELKARVRAILDEPDQADQRLRLALRVKTVTEELDRLYNPAAFEVPAKKAKPLTVANLRTYVSLYRKKTTLEPANATYAQKLIHYQTLLTSLTDETI
ncbi:hypothetical protein [Fibrella forsythiae]|uniref:Uncharacterized protein n=1 Tax=Fibrella forsythiae TaxID=2817061 RepID=A0ABS3JM29_9BACT|nr:hypothetical protein [Fibrella forsythiae]MBO0951069.1 hypothetical protein [Fibrella forsythiae]